MFLNGQNIKTWKPPSSSKLNDDEIESSNEQNHYESKYSLKTDSQTDEARPNRVSSLEAARAASTLFTEDAFGKARNLMHARAEALSASNRSIVKKVSNVTVCLASHRT